MNFSYSNPTQIQFGQGQIASIAQLIPKDKKVLLVYGGGSIKQNGIYNQVITALQGHAVVEFAGVKPNPIVEQLDDAVQLARKERVDFILAVGGGSVIDAVKYIAGAFYYQGEGWDILKKRVPVERALPLGAILTLPATGSESNPASVIGKASTNEKLSFISPAVLPKFAVLDPDVIKSLPERQVANGVVDAFVHVCEQYLTYPTQALVQEGYAEALLKTLLQLGKTIDQQDDAWRANLMWAANQALNGLIGTGVPQDWATHMIGHELTALYGVDHARSLAIIQPALLRNQLENKRAKLMQLGKNVFNLTETDTLAEDTIQAMEAFYLSLKVETRLTSYGQDKDTAIEAVIANLKSHGMARLGEKQAIGINHCREILAQAID
ncbi:iron-containing alcohol dehydrogenase [Alteromonas sp. a30]|uniref:iron-containing alcohol dehydrogenase n=1 Tax=Alteromonas sp. a30 TaxID=2730917 RepID=UPI00227F4108|nr:iron-containing alcohol dehydrogenase [Alteromonas sp. a30]MCY7295909.1 iron-containing alcohol dehydrogenase [Alteromonas sp. a30]